MEIQQLTVSERIKLAEALWDSVADKASDLSLTEAQQQELLKRIDTMQHDQDNGESWDVIKKRILNRQ